MFGRLAVCLNALSTDLGLLMFRGGSLMIPELSLLKLLIFNVLSSEGEDGSDRDCDLMSLSLLMLIVALFSRCSNEAKEGKSGLLRVVIFVYRYIYSCVILITCYKKLK